MMRLSDEIAIGRMLLRPIAGIHNDGQGGGCALGMANAGGGREAKAESARLAHPWLFMRRDPNSMPCGCGLDGELVVGSCMCKDLRSYFNTPCQQLVHLFNYHVMTVHDWTLDQLIDWIRSVEPAEEEEVESAVPSNEFQAIEVKSL